MIFIFILKVFFLDIFFALYDHKTYVSIIGVKLLQTNIFKKMT